MAFKIAVFFYLLSFWLGKKQVSAKIYNGCYPNPCLNGGFCFRDAYGNPLCVCAHGYTGYNCQSIISGCLFNPCLNGGTCTVTTTGSPCCICTSYYTGPLCETPVKPDKCLLNNPCQNGGSCMSTPSGEQYCYCTPQYAGKYCEYSVNSPCVRSNPCQNSGTCFYFNGDFSCLCQANFYGTYCQVKLTRDICNAPDTNSSMCAVYASQSFCSFAYKYQWIPIPVYCPSSCGACTQVSMCADEQTNCSIMAYAGKCEEIIARNPNECRKSCGLCGDLI